jgi:transposase
MEEKVKTKVTSVEVRQLKDPIEKALFMFNNSEVKISKKEIYSSVGISKQQLDRAIKAQEENRDAGRLGRPKKVLPELEKELIEWIKTRVDQKNCPTSKEVIQQVRKKKLK